MGAFHVKGWGPKSSVCPSKPRESNFCGGNIPGFCRDFPEAPEKFEKKKFGFNFWPLREDPRSAKTRVLKSKTRVPKHAFSKHSVAFATLYRGKKSFPPPPWDPSFLGLSVKFHQ